MFKKDNTILVVVDVQGKLATLMHQKDKLYSSIQAIIKAFKIMNIPIIWVEQIPDKIGKTVDEVSILLEEIEPIKKSAFSCCKSNEFMHSLKESNRKEVVLIGIETHICVYQTSFDLFKKGYKVEVVSDAVSSRSCENKKIGLEKIKSAGAQITSVETILFELLQDANDDNFKSVISLIK